MTTNESSHVPAPMYKILGALSSIWTRCPALASAIAAVKPARPLPMTITCWLRISERAAVEIAGSYTMVPMAWSRSHVAKAEASRLVLFRSGGQ